MSLYDIERERREDAWATVDYYSEAYGATARDCELFSATEPEAVFELVKGDLVVTFAVFELGVSVSGAGRAPAWFEDFEAARQVWRDLVAAGYRWEVL